MVSVVDAYGIYILDMHIKFKNIKTGETGLLNDSEFDGIIGHDVMRGKKVAFISSKNLFFIV